MRSQNVGKREVDANELFKVEEEDIIKQHVQTVPHKM